VGPYETRAIFHIWKADLENAKTQHDRLLLRISDAQHGSLKGRSIVTNLVEFSNSVIGEMENGRQVDGVYTDFSKAFDRVIHSLLYVNLSKDLEGPMLSWTGSYLTGRNQRVKIDDHLSEPVYCHSGVPQASHLGP
jgi:Reverse transcriptase (RNA-dependent DNA polymerase)